MAELSQFMDPETNSYDDDDPSLTASQPLPVA